MVARNSARSRDSEAARERATPVEGDEGYAASVGTAVALPLIHRVGVHYVEPDDATFEPANSSGPGCTLQMTPSALARSCVIRLSVRDPSPSPIETAA